MSLQRIKSNPAFLTEEELLASFVVRQEELKYIVEIINNNNNESNQHILIIGPRGSGKTMLMLRTAAEIKNNNAIYSKWHPIIFSEENYEILTAGQFWLNTIYCLSNQTTESYIKEIYYSLKNEIDDNRLGDRAFACLMDYADKINKKIIIIFENFNMLLEQFESDEDWKIRKILQTEPRIMFLATSTSRIKNERESTSQKLYDSSKALFELFLTRELTPITNEEIRTFWKSITGFEVTDSQIRPLQILTGSNLRLLTIISSFEKSNSFRELMDNLEHLIDDHTPYLKDNIESLPVTERKVFTTLMNLWDNSQARAIAREARMDINKVSSLLKRLESRGAVNIIKEKGTNKYQVTERLYNIYYLMRKSGNQSERVRLVIDFMVNYYDKSELQNKIIKIVEEACQLEPPHRKDHITFYNAITQYMKINNKSCELENIIKLTPSDFFNLPELTNNHNNNISSTLNDSTQPSNETSTINVKRLNNNANNEYEYLSLGSDLSKRYLFNDAISKLQTAILLARNNNNFKVLASSLKLLGEISLRIDDINAAKEHLEEALILFNKLNYINEEAYTIYLLGNHANRIYDIATAKACFKQAIIKYTKIDDNIGKANVIKAFGDIALKEHKITSAKKYYKHALKLYSDNNNKIGEANTLNSLGFLSLKEGKQKESKEFHEKAYKLYNTQNNKLGKANSLIPLGHLFLQLNDTKKAKEYYEQAQELYKDIKENLGEANALKYLGELELYNSNNNLSRDFLSKALDKYRLINNKLGEANTLNSLGDLSFSTNCINAARNYYVQALEIFDSINDSLGKANTHCALGKLEAQTNNNSAIIHFKQALDIYHKAQNKTGEASVYKELGSIEFNNNKHAAAIEYYNKVLNTYRQIEFTSGEATIQNLLGNIYLCMNNIKDAKIYFEQALSSCTKTNNKSEEAYIYLSMSSSVLNNGNLLHSMDYLTKALTIFNDINDLHGQALANCAISEISIQQNDLQTAEIHITKALNINPKDEHFWYKLIKIKIKQKLSMEKIFASIDVCFETVGRTPTMLNIIAWLIYEDYNEGLSYAEKLSKESNELAPNEAIFQHTLASITGKLGRWKEALNIISKYINNINNVNKYKSDTINFFISSAAAGYIDESLELLEKSNSAKLLEPLIAALKILSEKDFNAPQEIIEVANDIVKNIKSEQKP